MKFIKILTVFTVALLAAVTVSAHERGAPKDVGKHAVVSSINYEVSPAVIDAPDELVTYQVQVPEMPGESIALLSYSDVYAEVPAKIEYAPLKYRRSDNKNFAFPVVATAAMPRPDGVPSSPVKPPPRE